MKYSEFLQLSEILESQGTTISKEFRLNEAPDPSTNTNLKTEKGGILTRWGRMKSKLNKIGKDTQKQLMKDVINKYFPALIQNEKNVFEKVKANKEQDPKKLQKLVNTNYAAIKQQQEKQSEAIDNAVTKYLSNITQKINTKIDASKVTDKNKLLLKNYWILLTTQISMNVSSYMVAEREKLIDSIFGENQKAAADQEKALILKNRKDKIAKRREEAKKEAEKIKAEEQRLQTSIAETKPDPIKGKVYKYVDPTEGDVEVTITAVSSKPDGGVQFTMKKAGNVIQKNGKSEIIVSKSDFKKNVGEEIQGQQP